MEQGKRLYNAGLMDYEKGMKGVVVRRLAAMEFVIKRDLKKAAEGSEEHRLLSRMGEELASARAALEKGGWRGQSPALEGLESMSHALDALLEGDMKGAAKSLSGWLAGDLKGKGLADASAAMVKRGGWEVVQSPIQLAVGMAERSGNEMGMSRDVLAAGAEDLMRAAGVLKKTQEVLRSGKSAREQYHRLSAELTAVKSLAGRESGREAEAGLKVLAHGGDVQAQAMLGKMEEYRAAYDSNMGAMDRLVSLPLNEVRSAAGAIDGMWKQAAALDKTSWLLTERRRTEGTFTGRLGAIALGHGELDARADKAVGQVIAEGPVDLAALDNLIEGYQLRREMGNEALELSASMVSLASPALLAALATRDFGRSAHAMWESGGRRGKAGAILSALFFVPFLRQAAQYKLTVKEGMELQWVLREAGEGGAVIGWMRRIGGRVPAMYDVLINL